MADRINVTKTFLPPFEEYEAYLKQIWENAYLTNGGPLVQQFEQAAKDYLDVSHFRFVANGTLALQLALRVLDITEGEVITTPFTYVATTSAILWEHCTPVYVDIDPKTLCIDPNKIEAAITPNTKAIMAVHVFGHACDVEAIQQIAQKHDLKVIYDAAHAFGVTYNGKSLFDYGDISIGSFHATKLFHTIEGGCLVTGDKALDDKIDLLRRFGHTGDEHYSLGINAKGNEFEAAMGLCNLKYVDKVIEARKAVVEQYDRQLEGKFELPKPPSAADHNYGYYPVLLESEEALEKAVARMQAADIYPRRYFYPSLNKLPYTKDSAASCPVSEDVALRILCLPLYVGLEAADVKRITEALIG